MIRESDVNSAMLQQAADELEIAVPIRSWHVEDGELVLYLAYGGAARWRLGGENAPAIAAPDGVPWRFERDLRDDSPRAIPDGDLGRLKKRELFLILMSWGYQTETLRPLKAEYVEALTWLRSRDPE